MAITGMVWIEEMSEGLFILEWVRKSGMVAFYVVNSEVVFSKPVFETE